MRWMRGLWRQAAAATLLVLVFGAPRIGWAAPGVPFGSDTLYFTWPTAQGGTGTTTTINGVSVVNFTEKCSTALSPCISNVITGLGQARFFSCLVNYSAKTATPVIDIMFEQGIDAITNPSAVTWNNYAHFATENGPTVPKQDYLQFGVYNGSNALTSLGAVVVDGGTTTPAANATIGGYLGDRARLKATVSGVGADITFTVTCQVSGE